MFLHDQAEPYPAPVKAMMELLGVPGGVCWFNNST